VGWSENWWLGSCRKGGGGERERERKENERKKEKRINKKEKGMTKAMLFIKCGSIFREKIPRRVAGPEREPRKTSSCL
jgi:hypothetical protein